VPAPRHLIVIYDRVEARATSIARTYALAHADEQGWPCRRGCDRCCHELGAVPLATRPEWEALWEAVARLPLEAQRAIRARAEALVRAAASPAPPRHFVCPFLDAAAGACLVYEGRLGACRMHGFYVARDGGRWCGQIEELAQGQVEIVWGSHDGVVADLEAAGGPSLTLAAWLAEQA
jgi:Fe-S-cluster containining protein